MTCPIQKVMEFLGKKWTLQILYTLKTKGNLRFNDLELNLKICPRSLSMKLSELEERKIIIKEIQKNSTIHSYTLTKKGKELVECFSQLNKWTKKYEL